MSTKKSNEIVKKFLSSDFKINEKNLTKFSNKLRKNEFDTIINKPYTYNAVSDFVLGDCTSEADKTVTLNQSTNRLINAREAEYNLLLAYKVNYLMSCFHEGEHEIQFDKKDYYKKTEKAQDPYSKAVSLDCEFMQYNYNTLSSLMEIDARYKSIKKVVSLIKSNDIPDKPEIYPFILGEIFNMMDGINDMENHADFQEHPFNAYRVLQLIDEKYEQSGICKISENFKKIFKEDFESKMKDFFENEYKFVVSKVVENYKPTRSAYPFLTANWKKRVTDLIEKPVRRDLIVLTKDAVKQVKLRSLDFEYTKEDLDEFLVKEYRQANSTTYKVFLMDNFKHKYFEQFIMAKYVLDKNPKNQLIN